MPGNNLFPGLESVSSAMGAERRRMTIASLNLAHAGSTRKEADGLPYARQRVRFEHVLDARGNDTGMVRAEVVESARYTRFHDPEHPDADPVTGMVTQSDIDPVLELTDLMLASRAYGANANAAKGLMRMHEQALRIGEGG